ncbi:hypothetical protein NPIL_53861 [Nephila pilipes]|uniref:Uncharacterized protein n=1 Tax=Nephila pilipes TaxID=299642 RepID=A0A8X6PAX7_NEPPI|nr:hypothetical protein NPIL_53861 [Nephila pilipes]
MKGCILIAGEWLFGCLLDVKDEFLELYMDDLMLMAHRIRLGASPFPSSGALAAKHLLVPFSSNSFGEVFLTQAVGPDALSLLSLRFFLDFPS